jgi:glutamine cyclotransferase
VDLETGRVLQIYDLPAEYFGEGITIYRDKIIQLTWKNRTGFVYERKASLGPHLLPPEGCLINGKN